MKTTLQLLLLLIGITASAQDNRMLFEASSTNNQGQIRMTAIPMTVFGVFKPAEAQLNWATIKFGAFTGASERVATVLANGNLSTLPLSNFTYTSNDGVAKSANNFSIDWAVTDTHYKAIGWLPTWSEVSGKPTLFDGDYNSLTNRPSLFSGAYNDLTGKPTLFSGAYSDLSGKPTLFSGAYADLSGKPTIPTNNNQLTNGNGYISSYTETDPIWLAQKSGYSTTSVANGLYYPISSNPAGYLTSIAAQSFASLTGKPTTLLGYGITDAYPLIGNPSNFLTSVPAQSFTSLTGKPTTLSGYGITDAYPLSGNPSNFLTSINSGNVTTALGYTPTNPNGTNLQYTAGDGSKITFPTSNTAFTNGAGYLTSQDAYSAGFGILKTGTAPSYTLAVDQTTLMTVTAANAAIADMTTNINGKVPQSRTISINGASQNLANDQVWTNIGIEIPSQTGNSGKVLSTNGSAVSWQTPSAGTYSAGTGIGIASNTITNTAPDQTVSLTGANNLITSGTYPNFTITQYIPTITNAVTRPVNSTTFTVSATKQAYVNYNVTISCTATIGSAASGSVALQYSTNAGSTWNTVGTVANSNTVTLAVVLNSVQVSSLQVGGFVPANSLCRMVSTSSGVNAVITYNTGQEVY